jgi:hypothetical protein
MLCLNIEGKGVVVPGRRASEMAIFLVLLHRNFLWFKVVLDVYI